MKDKDKKKKLSSSGMSTKEKMLERKKKLESKGNNNGLIFPKEGSTRIRLKSPGDDQEIGIEVIQFYLQGIGSIISPATFDEPCPFMEKYQELKASKDEDDKELAKHLIPRRKYVVGGIIFQDDKGTKPDFDGQDKGIMIAGSVYNDIIDLYLDEDEAGDMTDPKSGYDIKIIRSGSGKMDTSYSVRPCKPTKLDKRYAGNIDLEGIVRAQIESYDELESKLEKFLNEDHSDDEEEDDSKRGKKDKHGKSSKKDKKKKKYKSDI